MPANQDLRSFFQGSPLAFIYKVPLLFIVGLLFAVYSGIKAFLLRLPHLLSSLLHYADVYYDQLLRFVLRWSRRFYEGVLRPIPSYVTNHVLPWMSDAMIIVIDSAVHWTQLCFRSLIQPIVRITYNFLLSLFVAVARRCSWFWLHCLKPLYPFIRDHCLPWLARNLLHLFRTVRWYFIETLLYIDLILRYLLQGVLLPVYRASRTVIVYLAKGIYRWTRTIVQHLVKYLFLLLAHLARNLISAYYAVKSLYCQYVWPWLTRLVALLWLIGEQIWTMVLLLTNAVQRFGQFFSNSILPALVQALSTSSSLLGNVWMEVKTSAYDAVQVVSQLIDGIYRHVSTR